MPFSVPDHPEVARLKTVKFERDEKAVFIDQFTLTSDNGSKYDAKLCLYNDKKEQDVYHYTVKARHGKRSKLDGMSGIITKTVYTPCHHLSIIKKEGCLSDGGQCIPVLFQYTYLYGPEPCVQYTVLDWTTDCHYQANKFIGGMAILPLKIAFE
jgi:hypothetical protein